MHENRPEAAIAIFRQALRQTAPTYFLEWFEDYLADAYLKLGRLDEAIAEYHRALRRYPAIALARYHLAVACQRKGRPDLARAELQSFLELWKDADPNIPELIAARNLMAGRQ